MRLPSYASVFEALTGFSPRAYQEELVRRLLAGEPPDLIHVPTGQGKTLAAFLAWLYSLVADAAAARRQGRPRGVAMRLYYTVDRRVVVDGAYETVLLVIERLRTSDNEAVVAFRQVMADVFDINEGDELLQVCRLRGGLDRSTSSDYVRDPHRPAVILTTVDMGLSRLLFRGYQLSPRRRSIEAGLAAADCLWVVDEPHLVRQALTTLRLIAEREIAAEDRFGASVPPLRVISMTATPQVPGDSPVSWDQDEEERRDPSLAQRRYQREGVRVVVEQTEAKPDDALAAAATELVTSMKGGESAVVFCTTVATARSLRSRLSAVCGKAGVRAHLLTGGMPGALSAQIVSDLAPIRAGVQRQPQAEPILVIATSTLEVGADLDFDHLVTQSAEAGSLIQRLGRVNRVGARSTGSVRIIHSRTQSDPVHGEAAARVAELLDGAQTLGEVQERLRRVDDPQSLRRQEQVPILLPPSVLRAYTRTTGSPHEAPVSPFIRALDDPAAECHLVVRQGVELMVAPEGQALLHDLEEEPPHLPTEAWDVRLADLGKVAGQLLRHAPLVLLDPAQVAPAQVLRSSAQLSQVRPGSILIAAPHGLEAALGVPGADIDLSERRVLREGTVAQVGVLWRRWAEGGERRPPVILTDFDGEPRSVGTAAADHLAELVEEVPVPDGWVLEDEVLGEDGAFPWLRLRLVRPAQELSLQAVALADHQAAVGELAVRWAHSLGLPRDVAEDLRLAGTWHDAGKADSRMQVAMTMREDEDGWLSPGQPAEVPLAKSALPRRVWRRSQRLAGLPGGWRHEAASAQRFDVALAAGEVRVHDPELVRHLILSHHGHFRGPGPLLESPSSSVTEAYQDARDQRWAQQMTSWRCLERRYGPYTLALAEAVLRLADWEVSRKEQVHDGPA